MALVVFPYALNRSVLNKTEVIDASGKAIGRLNCEFGIGSSIGHAVIWAILIVITLASVLYAYRVLRVVLSETRIVNY